MRQVSIHRISGLTALTLVMGAILTASPVMAAKQGGPGGAHGMEGERPTPFEMMDTDRDGKVTAEELNAHLSARFKMLDQNADGYFTSEDVNLLREKVSALQEASSEFGDPPPPPPPPPPSESAGDAEEDGPERRAKHRGRDHGPKGPHGKAGLPDKMIAHLDRDGDGKVSKEEFTRRAEIMMEQMDVNGDSILTRKEMFSARDNMRKKHREVMKERRESGDE